MQKVCITTNFSYLCSPLIKNKVMDFIKSLELDLIPGKEIPQFKAGDTITVNYKIIEGEN